LKAEVDSSSRGQKDFICREEKRRERLHGGMQQDPEAGGPVGQVENCLIAFKKNCLKVEMSLWEGEVFPCLIITLWDLLQSPLQFSFFLFFF
jgi:hypothetical protein